MTWFSDKDLRELAGSASYSRGAGYVHAVEGVDPLVDGVKAVVQGTDRYTVWLKDVRGELVGECTCPHAARGLFCKHCVAVGLAVLRKPPRPKPDLRGYLERLEKTRLVELLLTQAGEDEALFRRLALGVVGRDVEAMGGQIEDLLSSYTDDYARKASDVLDALEEIGDDERVALVARRVVDLLAEASEVVEDPYGLVDEQIQRAVGLCAELCAAHPVDAEELAGWLLRLDLVVDFNLLDFAEGLGDAGVAELRRLVEEEWRGGGERQRRLLQLREGLAMLANDDDELVDAVRDGVDGPQDYVRVARALRSAGRDAEAVEWASKGFSQVAAYQRQELVRFLVEAGEADRALELQRRELERQSWWENYVAFKDLAGRLGRWGDHRQWALGRLPGGDLLVRALLDENEHERAWAAFGEFGCEETTLLLLADVQVVTRPAEVVPIYRALVEDTIGRGGWDKYKAVVGLLVKLRRADPDFDGYVAKLRLRHKRKSSLLRALDKAKMR
ncbi:SWIM zinc finger family protein [Amycolatopsis xylanica]|uniref:SWIM zinc finger family protein n=1 Tax=Amycolatopsis xylanica TaxID=589385 RepID=UPI0015A106CA|nr:SWIM zinc finger family protein [Amycolatopsis xylanica]